MHHKLLELYKKQLSHNNILLKHIKWKKFIFHLICTIIFLSTGFVLSLKNSSPLYYLLFLPIGYILYNFTKKFESEVARVKQEVNNGDNAYTIRIRGLKLFLKSEGLDSSRKKIEFLINQIDQVTKESRIPFLVGKGFLAAIIIPIWVQSLVWVFNKLINNIEVLFFVVVVLLSFIFLFWIIFSSIKSVLYDEIMNSDYRKYKRISNDLKDILLKDHL